MNGEQHFNQDDSDMFFPDDPMAVAKGGQKVDFKFILLVTVNKIINARVDHDDNRYFENVQILYDLLTGNVDEIAQKRINASSKGLIEFRERYNPKTNRNFMGMMKPGAREDGYDISEEAYNDKLNQMQHSACNEVFRALIDVMRRRGWLFEENAARMDRANAIERDENVE